MTAGSVVAPQIIPIRKHPQGKAKHQVDTETPIAIKSDTPGVCIYYTVDGSKPAVVQRPGSVGTSTRRYDGPVLLPEGRVALKALAVTRLEEERPCLLKTLLLIPHKESPLKNLTNTQTTRIQRETDFLRCAQCLHHCPSDPFARFCLQCGAVVPPIPGQTLPPAEGGQMAQCLHCKTLVPVNTPTCVICEAPISPQLQPRASVKLQVDSAPPVPSREGGRWSCSTCKRLNHCDARYCDWCGSKHGHAASYVMCWRCGATCRRFANYCGACGVFLEGPTRTDTTRTTGGDQVQAQDQAKAQAQDQAQAISPAAPSPGVALAPPTAERQTQTVGLFYPSTTELHRKEQQRALESSRQKQMRDRWPLLTAISPGRGYWRKQLDHVAAHLRSYSQNNPHFRALIGEPRLGQVVSAVIQEDDYEVSLRINFASAGREKPKVNGEEDGAKPPGRTGTLSSVTEGSASRSSLG
ncbi:double zinc ribbon and ankyrin repeat-containing protein 1 [Diretmus argenteus]